MDHDCSILCGIAAGLGLLSHIFYFVRGEHHQHTLHFLHILFYSFPLASLILVRLLQVQYHHAIQLGSKIIASYLVTLWMSMLIYRAFFHRINSFPGPRLAKLSKFYQFLTGLRLDAFRRSYEAHQKYGNFVRTGKLIFNLIVLSLLFFLEVSTFNVFSFPLRGWSRCRQCLIIL